MGKISNKHRRALKNIKGHALDDGTYLDKENDDQIDAFHKQREMIPLDVNKDIKVPDVDDAEEPIFDLKILSAKKRAYTSYALTKKDIRDLLYWPCHHGSSSVSQSSIKFAPTAQSMKNGLKIISRNKDTPKRDDSAKRLRKHEPQKHEPRKHEPREHEPQKTDDGKKDHCSSGIYEVGNNLQRKNEKLESADKFCREVKKQRTQKIEILENVYTRPLYGPEEHASYVRQPVCREILENRGLTRYRKKLTKNPRKKYKIKHEKAMMRRKGQVRDIRRPTGPYGGEPTGINIHVSRSIRLD